MRHFQAHFPHLSGVIDRNAWWMTWNTVLAWLPVGLALGLFRRRDHDQPRSPLWWVGLGVFVLFLPNAPYVVTDLIHLGDDVRRVPGNWPVITAVLPVYAVFIASGFLAYYLALRELGRYLDRVGYRAWWGLSLIGAHAVCAVGVFLGRYHVTRLNSWEPVVQPRGSLERIIVGLSWRGAPVFILCTFLVTWAGYFVTKAVVEAAWTAVQRAVRQYSPLVGQVGR